MNGRADNQASDERDCVACKRSTDETSGKDVASCEGDRLGNESEQQRWSEQEGDDRESLCGEHVLAVVHSRRLTFEMRGGARLAG